MKIKIVELNNKSRKGTYLYIRDPKSKKSAYYKYTPGQSIQPYIQRYTGTYTKATPKTRKKLKGKPIQSQIRKGINKVKINVFQANNKSIKQASKQLLSTLVKDKQILDIITTDHNLQKLKNRIDYHIEIKEGKKTLQTANKHGMTPNEAIKQLQNTLKQKEYADTKSPNTVQEKLKQKGWMKTQAYNPGYISEIEMTITFRKG